MTIRHRLRIVQPDQRSISPVSRYYGLLAYAHSISNAMNSESRRANPSKEYGGDRNGVIDRGGKSDQIQHCRQLLL
jgi:hypothetical protein